jgi:hypothetical protein
VRVVIYLFNGNGWGDHFLAIPFIRKQIEKHCPENILLITYQNHIDNLFKNFNCQFIGLENSHFCFEEIKNQIIDFRPHKIFSFNAFYPFDFDFYVISIFKHTKYYGKFNELGTLRLFSFKNFAHIRDQYFLISEEKINYTKDERKFIFTEKENEQYSRYFLKSIGDIDYDNTVFLHLESEKSKQWGNKKSNSLIKKLLDAKVKVLILGQNNHQIRNKLKKNENLIFIEEKEIRIVFWLVSKSKFFIGIDSVFAHVADAYDVNSVVLFSHYYSHEWYHNSKNIITIYPEPGKKTKVILLEEVLYILNCKFPFDVI